MTIKWYFVKLADDITQPAITWIFPGREYSAITGFTTSHSKMVFHIMNILRRGEFQTSVYMG